MESNTTTANPSPALMWTGRVISALPVAGLLGSVAMKFSGNPKIVEEMAKFGWPGHLLKPLGVLELCCTLLYVIPQTKVLGAILLTGYLGGATATHVRIGDNFAPPIIMGVLLWLGLVLRDPRLRTLLPPVRSFAILAVVLVLGFLAAAATQPSEFSISRSAVMAAPLSEPFHHVNDLHKWQAWSPWAKLDPNAKNTFEGPEAGEGAKFYWSGNDEVGEGDMTITESRPNELVRFKLHFVKPMEDTCDTSFTFEPDGNQSKVTWTMSGKNNFVGKMFCLLMNMDKMIGDKFEEGLASLKTIVEGPDAPNREIPPAAPPAN